jgi:hypothetical protein
MPAPYLYPLKRHKRALSPGPFNRYQKYKPYLQQEFRRQCIYCRTPDGSKATDAFSVEHYWPKIPFGHLESVYSNLYYACMTCNRRKGNWYPKAADDIAGRFFPNPCDHVMTTHLRFVGDEVKATSVAGEQTLEKLMLNHKEALQHRAITRAAAEGLTAKRRQWRDTLSEVRKKLPGSAGLARGALEKHERTCVANIGKLTDTLAGLGLT